MALAAPFKDWLKEQQAPGQEVRQTPAPLRQREEALKATSILTSSPGRTVKNNGQCRLLPFSYKLWRRRVSSPLHRANGSTEARGPKVRITSSTEIPQTTEARDKARASGSPTSVCIRIPWNADFWFCETGSLAMLELTP